MQVGGTKVPDPPVDQATVPVGRVPVTVAVQGVEEPTVSGETQLTDVELDDEVTVKVVDASSADTDPTSLPDADTTMEPLEEGTVKEQEKAPDDDVVWLVQVCVAGALPWTVNEPMAVSTENPDPDTVTEEPTVPWAGLSEMEGAVMVKEVDVTTALVEASLMTTSPVVPDTARTVEAGIAPLAVAVNWKAEEQATGELVTPDSKQ